MNTLIEHKPAIAPTETQGAEFQAILNGLSAALAGPLAALRADLVQQRDAVSEPSREQVETLIVLCDELIDLTRPDPSFDLS